MEAPGWIAFALGGYLLGSVPFGVLIGRLHGVDLREHGSRNIGATNVGRVLGRPWGFLCFVLDAAKGAMPVLVAGLAGGVLGRSLSDGGGVGGPSSAELGWWLVVAAAALTGHMFSPFLGFRGGKGVATGFGALAAYWPLLGIPALLALAVWIAALMVGRIVSLASVLAAVSLPLWVALLWGSPSELRPVQIASAALALLVILRHRSNLGRLVRGEEPRIGRRRRAGSSPAAARVGDFAQNGPDVRA